MNLAPKPIFEACLTLLSLKTPHLLQNHNLYLIDQTHPSLFNFKPNEPKQRSTPTLSPSQKPPLLLGIVLGTHQCPLQLLRETPWNLRSLTKYLWSHLPHLSILQANTPNPKWSPSPNPKSVGKSPSPQSQSTQTSPKSHQGPSFFSTESESTLWSASTLPWSETT